MKDSPSSSVKSSNLLLGGPSPLTFWEETHIVYLVNFRSPVNIADVCEPSTVRIFGGALLMGVYIMLYPVIFPFLSSFKGGCQNTSIDVELRGRALEPCGRPDGSTKIESVLEELHGKLRETCCIVD